MVRRELLCLALAGCGRLGFDAHGDGGSDGVLAETMPADAASGPGFGNPMHVEGISAVNGADPQLSGDGLELWMAVPMPYEIYAATRDAPTSSFTVPVIEPSSMMASADQTDPAITRDGKTLVFISNRTGTPFAYQMTRASNASAWSTPVQAAGMADVPVESLDLSPDGKTLYYVDFSLILHRTTRASVTDPFDGPGAPVGAPAGVRFPTVSEDELVMFYNSTDSGRVRWARRTTTASPFVEVGDFTGGVPGCLPEDSGDADISPDQNWLIIRCPDPWILERM